MDRTVLMDDSMHESLSEQRLNGLRNIVTQALSGKVDHRQYGARRDRGLIGKTMVIIAGGKFSDQIEDLAILRDVRRTDVVARVKAGLGAKGAAWEIHLVYELPLPEFETTILGTTGTLMDGTSFDIVGAGADDLR